MSFNNKTARLDINLEEEAKEKARINQRLSEIARIWTEREYKLNSFSPKREGKNEAQNCTTHLFFSSSTLMIIDTAQESR